MGIKVRVAKESVIKIAHVYILILSFFGVIEHVERNILVLYIGNINMIAQY